MTMTEQEFQALVQILIRAPVSQSEALWLDGLLLRLKPAAQPQPAAQPKPKV